MAVTAMPDFKPLYRHSFEEARHLNEIDKWRESFAENQRCRDFMDNLVREHFDGLHIKGEIPQKTLAEFGFDRTRWVLANHIQHYDYDGRFSPQNKAWADGIYISRPDESDLKKDPHLRDRNTELLLNSHNTLVNYLAGQVQQRYADLNLYDHRHRMEGNVHDQDFSGKLLIIRADVLNESARTPENQLFFCNGSGFGCKPHSSGRAVYGEFLIDGEKTRFNREDFIGICDDRYLADWEKEKLDELQAAGAPEETEGQGMTGMEGM